MQQKVRTLGVIMTSTTHLMDDVEWGTSDLAPVPLVRDIPTLNLLELSQVEPQPKRFVVPTLAPAGEVSLFTGAGSAGKSLLSQQIATAIAAGVKTLRLEFSQSPAIYITCEDDEEQLHWRQVHICKALNVDMGSLMGKLHLASLRGALDNAIGVEGSNGEFRLGETYDRLQALVERTGASFVALDNVAHLFTGNENDRGQVTRFVNALNRLAGDTGAAIVLLGHPNKSGDSYSGSTAWLNAVRSQFTVEHDLQTGLRTVIASKANYSRKGDSIRFAWVDWAFVHEDDLPPETAKAMMETARSSAENEAFLACLAKTNEQRRNVSHNRNAGNFAPKAFAKMPEARGIKPPAFEAAMERLLSSGEIEVDAELWLGNDRHPKRGIKRRGEVFQSAG